MKEGDPVKLRTGSVTMTVAEVSGKHARCTWHNKEGMVTEFVFFYHQLESAEYISDVVRLKSGGPLMTVVDVNDGLSKCTWFDKDGVFQERIFPSASLQGVPFPNYF